MKTLKITLPDEKTLEWNWSDFNKLPQEMQIEDVSKLDGRFKGQGVSLKSLLEVWGITNFAGKIMLTASHDNYKIILELGMIRDTAVLIHSLNEQPITEERGGPFRMMIPGTKVCKTKEVINNCANVKYVDGMEFGEFTVSENI